MRDPAADRHKGPAADPASGAASGAGPGQEPAPDLDLDLDRVVHEPVRLALLTVLAGARDADFRFLLNALGLTKGNLSSHLSRLEAHGLITVTKGFEGRTPRTMLAITPAGRAALDRHWAQLDALRRLGSR